MDITITENITNVTITITENTTVVTLNPETTLVNTFDGIERYDALSDLPDTGVSTTSYKVVADSTASNNGFYSWNGSSYDKDADLYNGIIAEGSTEAVTGDKIARKALGRYPFVNTATFEDESLDVINAILDVKIYGGNKNWRVAPFTLERNKNNAHYIRLRVYDAADTAFTTVGDNGVIAYFYELNYTEPTEVNGKRIDKITFDIDSDRYDVEKAEILIDWNALQVDTFYGIASYIKAGFDSKIFNDNALNEYITDSQVLAQLPEAEINFWDSTATFLTLPEVKSAVLDIKMFGNVDIGKDYAIRQWRYDDTGGRNFIGVFEYNTATGLVGNRVALWDENTFTYPTDQGGRRIGTVTLAENNSSGITIQITLDFAVLPSGVDAITNQPVDVFKFSKKLINNAGAANLNGSATISFTVNGINSAIKTPTAYDSNGAPSYCLMFIHGNNGDETDRGSTSFINFCEANNIAIISTTGQDEATAPFTTQASGWGNFIQLQRYIALYKYCQDNYNLSTNVIVVAGSMGGLVAGQLLYNKPFPITACFMAGPVPDLSYIFANGGASRQAPIRNAYGMDSGGADDAQLETFIQGYDWYDLGLLDVSGTLYKFGYPKLYITVGTGDSTFSVDFGGSSKYNEIVTALQNAGQYVYYKEIASVSHAANECYDDWITNNLIEKELGI